MNRTSPYTNEVLGSQVGHAMRGFCAAADPQLIAQLGPKLCAKLADYVAKRRARLAKQAYKRWEEIEGIVETARGYARGKAEWW